MSSFDEKRQKSLNALAGYGANVFISPFIEEAYKKFLRHTDAMDIDNTILLINSLESLRRKSGGFAGVMNAFIKDHPAKDAESGMQLLVMWKDALNIADENFEYRAAIAPLSADIKAFGEKVTEHEQIVQKQDAAKKAEGDGDFKVTIIDIMDYDIEVQKEQQKAKALQRKDYTPIEDQAAAFFAVPRSQSETDAFLDKFNREAPANIYKITNDDESMAEYNFLKGKGMYLQAFPLDDPGMQNILNEARVVKKDRSQNESKIRAEARERFGVIKQNGTGVSSYYKFAYSIPAIKSVDFEKDRITLMFARETPVGLKSSHVSIEMPLSKAVDLIYAEEKANAKKVAVFKRDPQKPEIDGMTKKLAFALRAAQMHSKAVLRRIMTNRP